MPHHDEDRSHITRQTHEGPVTISYRQHGRGEPLLLLHGFFGHADDWALLPELSAGHRSVMPDLRGHGSSTNPSRRFSFHEAARDVFAVLDQLQIGRCCAIGLSGGALTLLRMAITRPAALTRMVLVSACAGFPAQARAFMASFAAQAASEPQAAELRRRHVRGEPQVQALLDAAGHFASGVDDASVSAEELATVSATTLIVSGDRDPLYPLEVALRLYRGIPNAGLYVSPMEGHTPVFGASRAEFIARARSFLESSAG